jgi:hypothetical protein
VTVPEIVVPACAAATDAAPNKSADTVASLRTSFLMMFGELGGWEPETGRAIDIERFNIRISFWSER